MILAPIFAQLIYFALSRRREYLADASSALYTRYPEGLASALEKLAASTTELQSANKATAPMYTVNPFRTQGRSASDLTSTHPPISERVRILRAMAGASYADYDKAYRESHKGKGVVPASALSTAGAVSLVSKKPETMVEEPAEVERSRETSDVMWNLNKYQTIQCGCGVKLRVPPQFKAEKVRCPRCGRILNVRDQ